MWMSKCSLNIDCAEMGTLSVKNPIIVAIEDVNDRIFSNYFKPFRKSKETRKKQNTNITL